MAEITTVTFDLWQTLLLDRPEVGRNRSQARLSGAREALLRAGEPFDDTVIEEAYRSCIQRCQEIREEMRDISFREQVAIFVNGISPGLVGRISEATFQEIITAYSDCFFEYPARPHPDGVEVLNEVRGLGLKLGLISNTGMTPGASFRRFLVEHGMMEYFDVLTFSDEVGLAKPSREIFALTLEKLSAEPSQAIHVGDHIFNDVAAAREFGMKTVWIEGFYERPDTTDPATQPDASVANLGEAVSAIRDLVLWSRE